MNLTAVLVTGPFARGPSSAAVQGCLLAGLVTRQRTNHAQHVTAPAGLAQLGVHRRAAGEGLSWPADRHRDRRHRPGQPGNPE